MPSWTRDAFLEECLGYPVFHLKALHSSSEAIAAATGFSNWLIDARVPAERLGDLASLTTQGFRVVDTNVQLSRAPIVAQGAEKCRFATAADEPSVRAIAATAFSQTRFHADPLIRAADANRIKEEWVANFFRGRRGEWMIVAEDGDRIDGFLQVLRRAGDTLVIDLIAVAERARGKGVASAMIEFAAEACLGRPAGMLVGTQIANTGSLGLYTRLGFRVESAAYVLHLHRQDWVQ